MKRFLLIGLILCMAVATTSQAADIAISTQAGWWPQADADREMQEVADNVTEASVELFPSDAHAALADWVVAHTGDGVPDLLILCGVFPDSIYPGGNAQPDDSLAELFLDDGNTIINTGDWIFYVNSAGSNNAEAGLQNMMDLPGIAMWGDGTPCVVTTEGQAYTPSLVDVPSTRPFFFGQLGNGWAAELVLAQAADASLADPAILRNEATGGRLGIFVQAADTLMEIRGEVISEWINNWYLPLAEVPMTWGPTPVSGTTGLVEVTASWMAPVGVENPVYDVYAGTNPDALELLAEGLTEAEYDFGTAGFELPLDTTYYWRVDADGVEGPLWSFSTEPATFEVTGVVATSDDATSENFGEPAATVDGSGLADGTHGTETITMWGADMVAGSVSIQYELPEVFQLAEMQVWNSNGEVEAMLGFGFKDTTIEYSVDGENWTVLADVVLPQAPATPDYTGTTLDLEGITAKYVKLTANSNYSMMGLPTASLSEVRFMYVPKKARLLAPPDGALNVDPATVLDWIAGRGAVSQELTINGETMTVAESSYEGLVYGMPYVWKVDTSDGVDLWEGDEWKFWTAEFSDSVSGTLAYDTAASTLDLELAADLGMYAPDTLRVTYAGKAIDFTEADGVTTIGAAGADIWGNADQMRYAYQTLSGDADLIVRVDSIDNVVDAWAKAGLIIRQDLTPGSIYSGTFLTGGNGGGGTFQWRSELDGGSSSNRDLEGTIDIDPGYYIRLVREGDTFTGYFSADGIEWLQEGTIDVPMVDPVYVGLGVTSHSSGNSVVAQFSELSTEGDITGDVTVEAIGVDMPANDTAGLYVSVEDAAGASTAIANDDPAATNALGTQIWDIPVADIAGAGVDVTTVTSVTIGAGAPDAPADGSGTVDVSVSVGTPLANNIVPTLVAHYALDGDLTDSSGNGPTGTIVGEGITFVDDAISGQALSLPGGDDNYVSIGSVGIIGPLPKTIACWAKADNTNIPDWTLVFGFTGDVNGNGGTGSHFNIGSLGGPGGVGAHVWGWEETIFSDEEALEWHHYAMSYDGTTIQYYGDGVPMDTDPGKSNVIDLSLGYDRVHIGSRITQASSFPGLVDDARVYNYVLTDAEVADVAAGN